MSEESRKLSLRFRPCEAALGVPAWHEANSLARRSILIKESACYTRLHAHPLEVYNPTPCIAAEVIVWCTYNEL